VSDSKKRKIETVHRKIWYIYQGKMIISEPGIKLQVWPISCNFFR